MDSRVLFISPYPQDAHTLSKMLDGTSIPVEHVSSLKDAARELEQGNFGVILTEAELEDGTWLNVLGLSEPFGIRVVVTNVCADARFWADAINRGAYDVLAQPFHRTEVGRVLASASSHQGVLKAGMAAF